MPALDEGEFQTLADQLGVDWRQLDSDVQTQLRRPRMLHAAANIPSELLNAFELSYPMLMLLDLKQRGPGYRHLDFAHFENVLRDMGQRLKSDLSIDRRELENLLGDLDPKDLVAGINELCDAGVLESTPGKFKVRARAAVVARAAHLVQALRDQKLCGYETLRESVIVELQNGQADATGEVLATAVTVALFDRLKVMLMQVKGEYALPGLDHHDPVLAALLAIWQRAFNAGSSPRKQARWLLPEWLWFAEKNPSRRDMDRLIAAAIGAGDSPWHSEWLQRLHRWFTSLYIEDEPFTGPGNPDRLARRELIFSLVKTRVALRKVNSEKRDLRKLGIRVITIAKIQPDANLLRSLVFSVAVQPEGAWDEMHRWVQTMHVDWWHSLLPIWRDAQLMPEEAKLQIGLVLRSLYPTPACLEHIPDTLDRRQETSFSEPQRFRSLFEQAEMPNAEESETLTRWSSSKGTGWLETKTKAAAVALWQPMGLQASLDNWLELVLSNKTHDGFIGARLSRFAPLINAKHARQLLTTHEQFVDLTDGKVQKVYISLIGWWGLSPARRIAAVIRQFRHVSLTDNVLVAAPLAEGEAVALLRRIANGRNLDDVGQWAFWIHKCFRGPITTVFQETLRQALKALDTEQTSPSSQYWMLRLALDADIADAALRFVPPDWSYERDQDEHIRINYFRSLVLALAGRLSEIEAETRCHKDHRDLATYPSEAFFRQQQDKLLEFLLPQAKLRPRSGSVDYSGLTRLMKSRADLIQLVLTRQDFHAPADVHALLGVVTPEHPLWLQMIMKAERDSVTVLLNGFSEWLLLAFRTQDFPDARKLWDRTLDKVRNDEELLKLVVAALRGNGAEWLKTHGKIDPTDLPQAQLRAATLAGFGLNFEQRGAIQCAYDSHGGWIRKGFQRALGFFESDRLARGWYQRFRSARDWYEAFGSWHFHLEHVDWRHMELKSEEFPAQALSDLERYEETFASDRKSAIEKHGKELQKTRFGIEV